MISAETFMVANLIVWVGLLVALAIVERRQRGVFHSRNGARYRRLTTKNALKRIGKTR